MARGRPRKEFELKQIEGLIQIQCTQEEVCSVLETTDKTLNRWLRKTTGYNFSEYFEQKKAFGKASLRRKQWKLADVSPAMAIFLGKNYLGQKDKQELEHSGSIKSVTIIDDVG